MESGTLRDDLLYLEARLDAAVFRKLAARLRELEASGEAARIELVVNVPPKGGMPTVEPDWHERYTKRS